MDFLGFTLQEYFKSVNWNEKVYYTNLLQSSNRLLDFKIMENITVQMGKSISPLIKSSVSIGYSS
jgi:Mitochondrial distribution and morphology protein 10